MILDKIFKNSDGEFINILDVIKGNGLLDNYIYTMAEAHAIDLIAKVMSKCEIQTFEKIKGKVKKTKGDIYWTLNLEPNYYESGTKFKYKLATKLLTDKKVLIVINENNKNKLLYIADSYIPSKDLLYGKTFTDVVISDDEKNELNLEKIYSRNNSIYLSIENTELNSASQKFKINTKDILKAAQKSFIKANMQKWRLKNPGGQPTMVDHKTNQPISYDKYVERITDGLLSDEESIILLSEMFDLIDLNKDKKKDLSDFEKSIKSISDSVAQKWNIPLDIFYGSKTEKSTGTNDFISLAVEPYFKIIEDGFNIGLVGKTDYLKGEYIAFNKNNIIHKDILESSTGIDKLISSGFSRNEINELFGLPLIDEDWANEHYITKNYGNVEGGVNEDG